MLIVKPLTKSECFVSCLVFLKNKYTTNVKKKRCQGFELFQNKN